MEYDQREDLHKAKSVVVPAESSLIQENMKLRARLDEIRSWVADLRTPIYAYMDQSCIDHNVAVEHLRELVREE